MKKEKSATPVAAHAAAPRGMPFFQAKLAVNEPGDAHEKEADAMADHVMRMPAPQGHFGGAGVTVQRKCAACEQEDEKLHRMPLADRITPVTAPAAQRKCAACEGEEEAQRSGDTPAPAVGAGTESAINGMRGGGQPMPAETRGFMEDRFGSDFGNVRVHTGGDAGQLSRNLSARAFTTGNDIFFNDGEYAPHSHAGRQLLAHELTHVVQQRGTLARKKIQRYQWPFRLRQSREVSEARTETISGAPAAYAAWNGTFSWTSKFNIVLDALRGRANLIMRLHSTATPAVQRAWAAAIESRWSNHMYLRIQPVHSRLGPCKMPIHVDIQWQRRAADAHYSINPQGAGGTTGGRAGVGGTSSMTDWGTADRTDITHEFGHMIGNAEEYFTTNGTNYATGGRRGFRDVGGGIMNNPAEAARLRHFNLFREQVAIMLRIPQSNVTVIYDDPGIELCRVELGDFPTPRREPGDFPERPANPSEDGGTAYA
ncbi:eCIS core domain-containing protein [Chitinophaga rhizosphaerae]|uniref:eCIS core domain-containing protein n=1 Tax=Chitinophaga rhizosphaerae TaxID=1864947 RepID=UPI000F809ED0|nr:DUF4157 domain-containing protein [Chitinophaga rhizosphaerae]